MRKATIEKQLQAVEFVLNALPELSETYDEHLDDYTDPLPYVFLADALRHLEHKLSDGTSSDDILGRLGSAIDRLLDLGDSGIDALVVLALLVPLSEGVLWEQVRTKIGRVALEQLSRYRQGP